MHRLLRWVAMAVGALAAALEVRAWRQAFLGVGDLPAVAGRMVERHAGLDAHGPSDDLGWPSGVQEDDEARWNWERGEV